MNRITKLAFEGLLLASISLGSVAQAQPYPGGRDHHDRREWNRGHDRDREFRGRQDRREYRWNHYGGRYGYHGYRGNWRTGQRYPYYRNHSYIIRDYSVYDLPPPRRGYRYYRDPNGDIIMAAIAGGMIGLILGSAMDDHHHDRR